MRDDMDRFFSVSDHNLLNLNLFFTCSICSSSSISNKSISGDYSRTLYRVPARHVRGVCAGRCYVVPTTFYKFTLLIVFNLSINYFPLYSLIYQVLDKGSQ